jgi:hypothetical protein
MALPSFYTPPKDEGELDKRKELASMVKSLAATRSNYSPQELQAEGKTLAAEGAKLGITRNQLSNLYNQYKAEGVKSTSLGGTPELVGPPAPASSPAQTPAGEPAKPSMFASMSSTPTTPATATTPASTPLAGQQPQDNSKKWAEGTFRRLDEYQKLQDQPMGAWTAEKNRTRSLESEGGRLMRMARKLQRQGFTAAANDFAAAGAASKVKEPAIKTEEYLRKESQMADMARREEAQAEEYKRKQLEVNRKYLALQEKEIDAGRLPSYFGQKPS